MLGIDISPEMVRLGRAQERTEPLGVTYEIHDTTALPPLGAFDLVTAIYLLNYATSHDQLRGMRRSAYDNLVTGGRFLAYTVNPAYTLSKPNGAKYGSYFRRMTPDGDRYACDGEFVTEPATPYRCFQWSQEAHEQAIKEAGFRTFAWYPSDTDYLYQRRCARARQEPVVGYFAIRTLLARVEHPHAGMVGSA